ncbi:DUF6779 domain-containing protein [Nocardia alni]|uniref:DUF6779 domain-containing protein n=1 Tax=Nocardia alni TaxID=2815723 RepID=UPI001C23F652|nr:DUF6779 domain-containing protein [Nocardia alni]
MVSPARSSSSRRRRDHAGKLVIGSLILLGLVASAFLVFSSSVQLVRVGLVAALWAAVIGAIAATRYRREAAADQAKVHDLQTVYELQLEREVTVRREYERGIEARVRQEVGADAGEMAALRAELTVLRESLQRLFDGDLLVERPALRADAVRLQELPGASADSANDNPEETDGWDAWSSPVIPRYPLTPVFEPDHPEPPAFASPDDEPVTAETSVITAEDLAALDADEARGSADDADADADADAEPVPGADPEWSPFGFEPFEAAGPDEASTPDSESLESMEAAESSDADSPDAEPSESRTPTAAESSRFSWLSIPKRTSPAQEDPSTRPVHTESTPVGTSTSTSRRRRRAESEEDFPGRKLSVAEIMANLQSERGAR